MRSLHPEYLSVEEKRAADQERLKRFILDHGGTIPFDVFMQETLYGEGGFYHSAVIGAKSEHSEASFQTYASNTIYAELLVRFLGQGLEQGRFIELAGGMGTFKSNFLEACQRQGISPHYLSIDISDGLIARQKTFGGENVQASALQLPFVTDSITGTIFSNELVDAFPFKIIRPVVENYHLLRFEEMVFTVENGQFKQEWGEIDSLEFRQYWQRQETFLRKYTAFDPDYDLKSTQYFCVNLYEEVFLQELARVLHSGRIIIVDYGGTAQQLVSHDNSSTYSVRMYPSSLSASKERAYESAYQVDLTTDVNFTNLALVAESLGFTVEQHLPQGNFLWKQITEPEEQDITDHQEPGFYSGKNWQEEKRILGLSKERAFRVLVLRK